MSETRCFDLSNVAVILPTWNSERFFDLFPGPLLQQGIRPNQVLIIDSASNDNTVARARSFGFQVHEIPRLEFNHGGTRALAATLVPWAEFLVYTTHDAIMASPDTIGILVGAFDDTRIGAAYARQLPHCDADPFARHACAFNYPAHSLVKDYETRKTLGFKTIFHSNVLAAYRRTALEAIGSFPHDVITHEDAYVAAKMMLSGWKTAYIAEATVYHSHNQTLRQIFQRHFDAGVLYGRERWMREKYGEPGEDGMRFVRSEIEWFWKENPLLIPKVFMRTAAKYLGYNLGQREAMFSNRLKLHMGAFHDFWVKRP